jgi:hypothetical protein
VKYNTAVNSACIVAAMVDIFASSSSLHQWLQEIDGVAGVG